MTNKTKTAQELALEWLNNEYDYVQLTDYNDTEREFLNTIRAVLTPPRDDAVSEALDEANRFIDYCIKINGDDNSEYCEACPTKLGVWKTIRQALQSRAGQEEECKVTEGIALKNVHYQNLLGAIYQAYETGDPAELWDVVEKYVVDQEELPKTHSSKAYAVDVEQVELDIKDFITKQFQQHERIINAVVELTINHLEKQGYLTQKPDDGMVLVPREPCSNMVIQGIQQHQEGMAGLTDPEYIRAIYKRMIAQHLTEGE